MSMALNWPRWLTSAHAALVISICNVAWFIWSWKADRPIFRVEVHWNTEDDLPVSPTIIVRNVGRRDGYLETIEARAGSDDNQVIARRLNMKVAAGEKQIHRPDWSEGEDKPYFRKPWKKLKIAVEDGSGRWWLSARANAKPRWYYYHSDRQIEDNF